MLLSCPVSAVRAAVLFLLDAAKNNVAVPAMGGSATGVTCCRGARSWAVRDSSAAAGASGPGVASSRYDQAAKAPEPHAMHPPRLRDRQAEWCAADHPALWRLRVCIPPTHLMKGLRSRTSRGDLVFVARGRVPFRRGLGSQVR